MQAPSSTSELIQTALNYTKVVTPAQQQQQKKPLRDKDPKLMDLLYRSFQAKLARGDFNNDKKPQPPQQHQQQKQHQHSSEKSSTVTCSSPLKSNPTNKQTTQVPLFYQFQQQQQQHLQQLQQQQQQHQQLTNGHDIQCSVSIATLSQPPPVITTSPINTTDLLVNGQNQTVPNYTSLLTNMNFLQQQQQQQQSLLSMSQHPFYSTAAFQGASTTPAPMFSLPPQFLWPSPLSMAPTSTVGSYGTAYPPPQTGLPANTGAIMSPETFAYFQNNAYLAQMGLKRPHMADSDEDSCKRLRLATLPY